jgi:HlyD family secretion protein
MARNGARPEEKEAARGQYDRALGSLDEARAYVDETCVRSPIPGVIGKRYADEDEIVPSGFPVLTVLDTRDVWAELNLPETELARLRPGSVVTGTIHALGRSARFRVASIAAAADVANWRAQNDRGSFEVRSFTVTLRPEGRIPGLRPGMTVAVELENGGGQ